MRITLLRRKLGNALRIASAAVSNQVDLAILSNILIKATKNNITVSATDLEIGVTIKIRGKINEPGEITIPAQIFNEYVNNSNSEKIDLELKKDTLYLKDGTSSANIKGQPTDDYPQIPDITKESKIKISLSAEEILEGLNRVIIGPSQNDSRPVLAGVFFRIQPRVLTMAGTDSYRLAEEKISLEEEVKPTEFILPLKACQEVVRIIEKDPEGKIEILVSENQVGFRNNDTVLVSRQVEGEYPDYKQIIPTKFQTEAVVDREQLLSATKTAWLFSRDQANNIILKVGPQPNLKILATSPQVGESKSNVKLDQIKGPGVEISFNVKFITEALAVLKSDKVTLSLNEAMQPGMIKAQGKDNYLYLIMPLKNE